MPARWILVAVWTFVESWEQEADGYGQVKPNLLTFSGLQHVRFTAFSMQKAIGRDW